MKFAVYATLLPSLILLASCSQDTPTGTDPSPRGIYLGHSQGALHTRFQVLELAGLPGQGREELPGEEPALILRAEVDPPMPSDKPLRATDISVHGSRVYVAYNLEGDAYEGGVDVFDVSDPANPVLESRILMSGCDANAVDYASGRIYVAGATEAEPRGFDSPAFLLELENAGGALGDELWSDLPSYAGTGVHVHAGACLASSGDAGGLSCLGLPGLAPLWRQNLAVSRDAWLDDERAVALQGEPARLALYTPAGEWQAEIEVGGALQGEAKSSLVLDGDLAYLSAGEAGLKVVNLVTRQLVAELAPVVPGGTIHPEAYVTNAVALDGEGRILLANGAGGLYVAQWGAPDRIDVLGTLLFGEGQSANHVAAGDGYLFVAAGSGGLKIVEIPEGPLTQAVNFQPASAPVPEGFDADSSLPFDPERGFGWTEGPFSIGMRDRNSDRSPDQSYDTLVHISPDAVWEMALPDGDYRLTICAGDPQYPDVFENIQVEGAPFIEHFELDGDHRWIEETRQVSVSDGRLTLTFEGSAYCAKLCWLSVE